MAFNIETFKAEMNRGRFAMAANFDVQISRPAALANTDLDRDITFRCDQVEMPGRRITTSDVRYYGPKRMIPYDITTTEVTLMILLSEDMRERIYFEQWQDMIGKFGRTAEVNDSMYDMSFYESFIADAHIYQYEPTGKKTFEIKLLECYPALVGGVTATWQDSTQILRMQVQMNYRYYRDMMVSNSASAPPTATGIVT